MDLPKEITDLAEKFNNSNYKLYLVGGVVRDLLLGKNLKDWDFTTDASPEDILKILPEGFYNNQFGTVGLSTPLGIFEITTMRKEGDYNDSRHPSTITWTTDITKDLARRDFTVNAMALKLPLQNHSLNIIDPFNGQFDLEKKLIRAVGNPNIRFSEDALRLIRAVRFATNLGFTIEQKTFESILKNANLIKNISWERIRDEFLKIIGSDFPYEGIYLLRNTGLLEFILPELKKCFGIMQEGPKHDRIYEIGEHSALSLKYCPSPDPIVRFATLIHDIGKPETVNIQPDGNVTFYNHDIVGAKIAQKIAERFRLSRKQIEKIVKLVRWHLFTVDENQTDAAIRRFIKNVGVENIDDMLSLREADRLGGGTMRKTSWRLEKFKERIKEVQIKPFSVTDLKVNGKDVMDVLKIKPSRKVGEILGKLFQEVLEDNSKNTREYLLERIKQLPIIHNS